MNRILITMILLFTSVNMFSQNPLDPAKVFIKDTSLVTNSLDTQFVRGFNWSSPGYRLDSAMRINFYHHMNLNQAITDYTPNARLMQPLEHPTRVIIGGRNCNRLFQAHSLYLDPTIIVDSTLNFKPKVYDNTGRNVKQVFQGHLERGEQNIQGDIRGLKSGNYFVKVSSVGTEITFKLIINN